MGKRFVECGCCGAYHREDYHGDCRNDAERFDDLPRGAVLVWDDGSTTEETIGQLSCRETNLKD